MRKTLIAALVLLVPMQMAAAQDTRERMRIISVTGTGSVTAKPEIAEVQIGVQTEARTAAAALNGNTAAMNALFTTLKKDRKSTRLNSSHIQKSRMPSSA